MARARNIKPGLFKNEVLGVADPLLTILFESLWCLADREGRLEDRPLRIKGETFPYRDGINANQMLDELQSMQFILRYTMNGQALIQILNFKKHQTPHNTEKPSELPAPLTEVPPLNNAEITQAKPPDSLIPDSLIPDTGLSESPATAPAKASHITAVDLSIAMRKGGINCQSANPMLIKLAEQGVTPETVAAACEHAKTSKPGESLPLSYIVKVIEGWARRATDLNAQGARASPHRPEKFDGLAYVNNKWKKPNERTIDLDATGEPILEMVRPASET
jgi:hypothetical protein